MFLYVGTYLLIKEFETRCSKSNIPPIQCILDLGDVQHTPSSFKFPMGILNNLHNLHNPGRDYKR